MSSASDAEITEFYRALSGDEHVRGRNVAVYQSFTGAVRILFVMNKRETLEHLDDHEDCNGRRKRGALCRALLNESPGVDSVDVLHGHERVAIDLTAFVDLDDIRVADSTGNPGFFGEDVGDLRVAGQAR